MTRQEPSSCVVPAATQPVYSPSNVPDSKTETGIRIVELSPDLAEAFVDHLDRLRRAGNRIDPDDYASGS